MALSQSRVLEVLDQGHGLPKLLDFFFHGLPDLPLLHVPAQLADLRRRQKQSERSARGYPTAVPVCVSISRLILRQRSIYHFLSA